MNYKGLYAGKVYPFSKEVAETLQFGENMFEIICIYKDGSNEALDGDEVDHLIELLRAQANLIEGNITQVEYDNLIDDILSKGVI